jgi:calcineurin-like phosphoesterase family protein
MPELKTRHLHLPRTRVIEVVIGDVHGRADVLWALLRALGAVDARGRRVGGFWIVQLGDLLDRRADPAENLATARLAAISLDVVLAGNHEVRLLRESSRTYGAALATLASRGWPHAAAACGEWLVTHAGVHPKLACRLPAGAADCAEELNDRWHRRGPGQPPEPAFDWIGPSRGGDAPCGGIFWTHPIEWSGRDRLPWGQIVGHAPQAEPRLLRGRRWAIDVGARAGRLAAVVRRPGHERWRPVMVATQSDRSAEPRRAAA